MVMSIQALPFEVLLEIFQNLTTASLVNCATVCKAWYPPSTRVIYEHVELTNSAARKLEFYENQEKGVNVGTLARSLKIGLGYYYVLNQEQFLKLLSYMPYLKVIELDAPLYQLSQYLDCLLKRDKNCIQDLEYLNLDCGVTTSSEMQKYFSLAYSFRHTLKNLYICNPKNTYAVGVTRDSQQNDEKCAVEFLNDFPKLTRLTIENYYGKNDNNLSIFHIIRSCPNLTSFDFASRYAIPKDDNGDHYGVTSINNQPSSSTTIIVAKAKLRKLQNFALHLPNITEPQMQHILSSLPTTMMNSFKLELDGTSAGVWVQEIQETSLEQLGKYLGNVRQKSEFSITGYNKKTDTIINDNPSSIEITANFLPLISAIMKYRKPPYCHLQIRISDLIRDKLSTPVSIKKNNRYLFFSYVLDSAEYETHLFQSEIPELPLLQAVVPLPNSSDANEDWFNEKVVSSMEIVLEDTNMKHSRFLEILQTAIENCPLLKCISFTKRSHRYKLKFGCALEICDTGVYSHYTGFNFESYYGKNFIDTTISSTPKENLQYMLLTHAKLRQSAFPLLANLLPLTKVMKLTHCEIEKDESNNTTVDIRGMEHLQQLALDVGFVAKKRRYVFITVEMENNQVSCFKADGGPIFAPIFEPVTVKYIYAYNRFESVNSSTIIIKCRKIDEIGVSLRGDNIQTLIKPHLNTVAYP